MKKTACPSRPARRALAFAVAAVLFALPAPARCEESPFAPLDLPGWLLFEDEEAARRLPWILVVDDPQCPYCMQLHLAIERAKESADPEISRASVVRLPYPLPYHDQAAHIVMDAFCLQVSGHAGRWTGASYLDWLIVRPWRGEAGWSVATIEDLGKEGGFFDTRYDSHRVTSSRRRDFQTEAAKTESACTDGGCQGDAECEKLCGAAKECRAACALPAAEAAAPSGAMIPGAAGPAGSTAPAPSAPATAAPSGAAAPAPSAAPAPIGAPAVPPAQSTEQCLTGCTDRFVSARYRQYSKVHAACLLEEGPQSAHGKTATAVDWAVGHKVPGTPTIFAGHPSIGFRMLGDSDDLAGFMTLLRRALLEARARMGAAAKAP